MLFGPVENLLIQGGGKVPERSVAWACGGEVYSRSFSLEGVILDLPILLLKAEINVELTTFKLSFVSLSVDRLLPT